jgi:hypothetical protein
MSVLRHGGGDSILGEKRNISFESSSRNRTESLITKVEGDNGDLQSVERRNRPSRIGPHPDATNGLWVRQGDSPLPAKGRDRIYASLAGKAGLLIR